MTARTIPAAEASGLERAPAAESGLGAPDHVPVDRNGLEVLDRSACLQLLGTATIGRVGINSGALPVVLPVNFRMVGERIVFRTSAGTKLEAATQGAVVAFEVDNIDPFSHSGWSVCVTGVASAVGDPAEIEELQRAHVPRWAASDEDRFIAVSTEMVSGRRLVPGRRPPPQHAP